ncbi:MAG: nitrogen regulation protein NR(II), partial [Acidobacteriota bacterium]
TLAGHAAAAIEGARLAEENLERIREVELLKDYNESIVESSQVGILVLDIGRRIRVWNRTLERMAGLSREEVQGRHVKEIFPEAFVDLLDNVPENGRRVDRFDLSLGNRQLRTFNLAVAALRSKGGGQRGQVVTFDDVTDQVRMEQKLLQNERLAAVGLLASGVAHEINTPLAGISSYAEMLVSDLPAEDSVREILERIQKQSWRASNIANSLLNFSRGDGHDLEDVDLNEIVEETLALFGPQLKGRNVSIDFKPAPAGRPSVRGHRGRLQQVLLNLLLNARDAMGEGGCIMVSTRVAGEETVLEVRDTGNGIAHEDLERIYDPFFTTKKRGRGTGLGLSISYRIVQDHGGFIDVDSRPGQGSCFRVRLPRCRQERVPA